jgi:hypothetical protein
MNFDIVDNFKKLSICEKNFFITISISFLFAIYLNLYFISSTVLSLIITFVTISLIFIYLSNLISNNEKLWLNKEVLLYIILGLLGFHLPFFFIGSSRVSYEKENLDYILIKIDTFLLGNIFPKGQMSLYLDKNKLLGPHSKIGIIMNNILQIFYFMYYVIPYVSIYFVLIPVCIKGTIERYKNNGQKKIGYKKNWDNLFFTLSVYIITYCSILFINTIIPATSPRLYLKDEYTNSLELDGISRIVNKFCKDNKSANSFPSGHVAESLCIVLALFSLGYNVLGIIFGISVIFIFLSILVLRYHYFCDGLVGIIIAILSYVLFYNLSYKRIIYEKESDEDREEYQKLLNEEENTTDV